MSNYVVPVQRLKAALAVASSDPSRPVYNTICVLPDWTIATDGFLAGAFGKGSSRELLDAVSIFIGSAAPFPYLLSTVDVERIVELFQGSVTLKFAGNQCIVSSNDVHHGFSCRTVSTTDFPLRSLRDFFAGTSEEEIVVDSIAFGSRIFKKLCNAAEAAVGAEIPLRFTHITGVGKPAQAYAGDSYANAYFVIMPVRA